jgi:Domain of unknown function (DUF3598)
LVSLTTFTIGFTFTMVKLFSICLLFLDFSLLEAFTVSPGIGRTVTSLHSTTGEENDSSIQWDLFKKHHAKGSWKGVWTTYDYIGDIIDETVASVNLNYDESNDIIQQTHTIVVGAKRSDCVKCFDSFETKELPVAQYTPTQLHKTRLGSVGMVNGPTLLRSGTMATELVLSQGDGRVRVVFQHAPVWEAGTEPGSCPPQGLKLFRTMISREALREEPPTLETEATNPPAIDNPVFYRGVPPFKWHKEWAGTSWTWGPQAGNRGWQIDKMEEADAWHGRATGDGPNVWNLRLPGGILVQCPRVVTEGEAGICRLAWLANDDTLIRMEAAVVALEPMFIEDDTLAGFFPPSLTSFRCDYMKNIGELDYTPSFGEQDILLPKPDLASDQNEADRKSGLDAVRDALKP